MRCPQAADPRRMFGGVSDEERHSNTGGSGHAEKTHVGGVRSSRPHWGGPAWHCAVLC
ncbi:hypothetical protein FAIPA1_120076 [Frankia sp. AiPs1]